MEMKRRTYLIKCSDGANAIKYSWNSAVRHIEGMVRERGLTGEQFELVNSQSLKDKDGNHYQGLREWQSPTRTLAFAIHRFKEIDRNAA
jgi:hypothetical protein